MTDNRKPAKHDLFNAILKQGMTAHVDFTPQFAGIIVPAHLHGEEGVKFSFDYVRCRDLFVDSTGVSAGMTFNGRHFTVYVPWGAVYCISFDTSTGPRGVLYQDDMPGNLIARMINKAQLAEQQKVIDESDKLRAPAQASVEGGAKIYDLAAARARRDARNRNPAG